MVGNILVDPIAFMDSNVVLTSGTLGGDQPSAGLKTMCLVPYGHGTAKKHGHELGIFSLTSYSRQDSAAAVFQAFWCPYAQNNTFSCDLDSSGSLCFTALMDGCSFGVQQNGNGRARVGHANEGTYGANMGGTYGRVGQRMMQRDEQTNRLKHIVGDGVQVIAPDDYMLDHDGEAVLKSTTFGVRKGNAWEFYTQRWLRQRTVNGWTYFLRGVYRQI